MITDPDRIIDYTDPYDIEYACFMVSKPPPLPQWQALTTPLQPPVCPLYLLYLYLHLYNYFHLYLLLHLYLHLHLYLLYLLSRSGWPPCSHLWLSPLPTPCSPDTDGARTQDLLLWTVSMPYKCSSYSMTLECVSQYCSGAQAGTSGPLKVRPSGSYP